MAARLQVRPRGGEGVEAAPVGDPVRRQGAVGVEPAAGAREREQQVEAPAAVLEDPVPLVGGADHAVAEPVGGDGELDRHRRRVPGGRARLHDHAAVVEDPLQLLLVGDARQEVGAQHPLVVAHHQAAGRREEVGARHPLGRELVDHPVVEADEGEVGLADGQVLVVARVGDERVLGGARGARQVEARVVVLGEAVVRPRGAGRAREQVDLVGRVELRRHVGPEAVERVEVQARRAPLDEVDDRHGDVVAQPALVEGEVVVDELAEVGEPGRDVAVLRVARPRHRGADLAPVGLAELPAVALRALSREAEGPQVDVHGDVQGGALGRIVGAHHPLADDEVRGA